MFSASQGTTPTAANFIEDVFSTWLYTGNGSTQTITNGIDLAGKGGLVWMKGRSTTSFHALYDTARGATFEIGSDSTTAQTTQSQGLTSFLANGFSIGSRSNININAEIYTSWTFREQPKFFDVVTYTGNGANRTIAHNLGSVPGCIMVKRTDNTGDWQVYHQDIGPFTYGVLNSAAAWVSNSNRWVTFPTSTEFSLGTDATVNASGGTYVAYIFAHDAGGFGATGADNVISCGSYGGNGSATGPTVTLGYEPQWLLVKRALGGTGDWNLIDNMRGFTAGNITIELNPNLSNAESTGTFVRSTATGFQLNTNDAGYNASGSVYIYIAIRRGPMRTPTTGASVFNPVVYTGTNVNNRLVNTGIAPDTIFVRQRNDAVLAGMVVGDRLRGPLSANRSPYMLTGETGGEIQSATALSAQSVSSITYGNAFSAMNGFWCGIDPTAKVNVNTTANNHVAEAFRRAPGFFDVVCYTGDATVNDVNHNLGVVPELIIGKRRNSTGDWAVYSNTFNGGVNPHQYVLYLNQTAALAGAGNFFLFDQPTATRFRPTTVFDTSTGTYVAYLFASCPGVSKVGSYTGTGATQTINCGFAAGARFVLIKRTDSTGDWYVWDSARGIVAGNDPYLALNSTAAEVTTTDWVDTAASGFELSNAAGNLANTNGASYIFLSVS
jgi:hypothetical protein